MSSVIWDIKSACRCLSLTSSCKTEEKSYLDNHLVLVTKTTKHLMNLARAGSGRMRGSLNTRLIVRVLSHVATTQQEKKCIQNNRHVMGTKTTKPDGGLKDSATISSSPTQLAHTIPCCVVLQQLSAQLCGVGV